MFGLSGLKLSIASVWLRPVSVEVFVGISVNLPFMRGASTLTQLIVGGGELLLCLLELGLQVLRYRLGARRIREDLLRLSVVGARLILEVLRRVSEVVNGADKLLDEGPRGVGQVSLVRRAGLDLAGFLEKK